MHRPVLLIAIAFMVLGCNEAPPTPEAVRPVKIIQVAPQDRAEALTLAGEVRARYASPRAFRVGGKVTERHVDLGDRVKSGQLLAKIEATDYSLSTQAEAATVAAAKADLAFAIAELERHRSLKDKGFISSALLDQKEAQADAARARLDAAQSVLAETARRVEYTELTADADGVITWLDLNIGQVVNPGQAVAVIAHAGEREIEVHVPESALARVQAATGFEVALNALPGSRFAGRLRELAAAADPATRTYAARVAVDAPVDSLQLGMSATLRDIQQAEPVLRLPLSAVISRDGKPMVWKFDATDSTVRAAAIRTGGLDGDGVLVEAGVEPGDLIVTAGANLLREGQVVRALQ
jgi:membrane fusion protein, multidrug efflux system